MVAVEVTRVLQQVAVTVDPGAAASRLTVEVAGTTGHASAEPVEVTRVLQQVASEAPLRAAASRLIVEVAGTTGHASAEPVEVTRVLQQAAVALLREVGVTRLTVEVAGTTGHASAEPVEVTRVSMQVARRQLVGAIIPLPLPSANFELFLHNWARSLRMDTSFSTDVQTGATGQEERRGLSAVPARSLRPRWTIQGKREADRMLRFLRDMTGERFPFPLYQDQEEMTATTPVSGAGNTFLNIDTTRGRFFEGARVAIVQIDALTHLGGPDGLVLIRTISNLTPTGFSIGTPPSQALVPGRFLVFPLIDCELSFVNKFDRLTDGTSDMTLVLQEVPGPSALPAWSADNDLGEDEYDGDPIFVLEPDWTRKLGSAFDRRGSIETLGRGRIAVPKGDRWRASESWPLVADRTDGIRIQRFLEARRGRLRPFWLVDPEQLWTLVSIDASGNFIGIDETIEGVAQTLTDVQEHFDHVGLVMNDGTTYVREVVTVQQVLTVFRITVDVPLPTGLQVANAFRVSRARRVRNVADAIREEWDTTAVYRSKLETLEVLSEQEELL